MKRDKLPYLLFALASLVIFGCELFTGMPMEPVPISPIPPTEEVAEAPAPVVEAEPPKPRPVGILTQMGETISLYDRDGYTLMQLNTPSIHDANERNLHAGSAYLEGSDNLPIVYYSFEQSSSLLLSLQGTISTLIDVPDFSGLVGAAGKPILAYTRVEYAGDTLTSYLYASTIQNLPTAAPVYTETDESGWGIVALAVDVEAEQPVGVWYSKRPWGIGGDIVFEPRRTLSYLDLRSGVSAEYLGADSTPSALSDDRQWVAYSDDTLVGAGTGMMNVRNLQTGAHISYPLRAAENQRGAGEATFSPANTYLAWMEGNGWQVAETPNFHSVVRVGNLNGNLIAEFADTAFLTVSGLNQVSRVAPVGWFDEETLVVMVNGSSRDKAVIVTVNITTQEKTRLANGNFVGFVYR